MTYPLVSFVIFCYQHEKYIADAIAGGLLQDYPNLEIIISDDCSTDRSFEIIKDVVSNYHGPHHIITNKNNSNLGLANHINHVLSQTKGEFICWNGGDDIALPAKTRKLVAPMLENETIMGVDSGVEIINLEGKVIGDWCLPRVEPDIKSLVRMIDMQANVMSQSHAFRRTVLEKFGPLQPYVTNEGRPYAIREKLLGQIAFVAEPLTQYRMGSGISTHKRRDIQHLSINEPLKVNGWHLTTLLQIRIDLDKAKGLISEEEEQVVRGFLDLEIKKARIRKEIIEEPWNLKALWQALTIGGLAKRGTIDFIKRNAPRALLKGLYKG